MGTPTARPDLVSVLEELKLRVLRDVKKVIPATVVTYVAHPTKGAIVTAQISRLMVDEQGRTEARAEIPDVPVIFPGFGDFVIAGALKVGQPILLIVADHAIDLWLKGQLTYIPSGIDAPHGLSQCLALPMAALGAGRALHAQAEGLTVGKLNGTARVSFNALGTEATIEAASIKLGAGATEPVIKGAALASALNTYAAGLSTAALADNPAFAVVAPTFVAALGTLATTLAAAIAGALSAKSKVE